MRRKPGKLYRDDDEHLNPLPANVWRILASRAEASYTLAARYLREVSNGALDAWTDEEIEEYMSVQRLRWENQRASTFLCAEDRM